MGIGHGCSRCRSGNFFIKLFCMLLLFWPSYGKKKENKHKSESKVSVIDKRDCFWCNGSWNTGSDSKSFKCNRNDHFKQFCCWIWFFCGSSSRHCTKVYMVPIQVALGGTQGIMPLVGYSYASKNKQRFEETIQTVMKLLVPCMVLIMILCWIFAPSLIRLFMKK